MFAILTLVVLLQVSTWLQIDRLSGAQQSITTTSFPLLDESQQFARITAQVLTNTALLENDLIVEDLTALRAQYLRNEQTANDILDEIADKFPDKSITVAFEANRQAFEQTNDQLFANQFEQRAQEQGILSLQTVLIAKAKVLEDLLDQMLVRTTTRLLAEAPRRTDNPTFNPAVLEAYLTFASEVETLNTLKGNAFGISNLLGNLPLGGAIDELDKNVRFQIRSFSQSLILLRDGPERRTLARTANEINELLTRPDGLIARLAENRTSRKEFNRLKRDQADAVKTLDTSADQIVAAVTATFNVDILRAAGIARSIVFIGLAATGLVIAGILLVNHYVIRRQISARFTRLTEDVLAISRGDYARHIRVAGSDEIGDIARSLDVFKGQAAELQRSNDELERFACVAAHDLRSPLQAIQDLALWTLEDERENLPAGCIENLELMIKRSSRLSALQTDLLTYAKASDIDTSVATFMLRQEVEKLSDMLDPQNKFNIRLEGDPGTITTYALPARQILLNLITNAIKHHDKGEGQIIVRYENNGLAHKLTVEDDGPGIEPRFQEKIFELFKTLQSRDVVEGSGLGLALVTKLVERLGGTLSVHSEAPGQRGSKFVFEIADLGSASEPEGVAA